MLRFVIIAAVFFVLGVLAGVVLCAWSDLSADFFDIKLVEIIELVLVLIIATAIAYWSAKRSSHELRRKEFITQQLEKLDKCAQLSRAQADNYIAKPTAVISQRVLRSFQSLSNSVDTLRNLCCDSGIKEVTNRDCDSLKKDYLRFKRVVTNSPFGEPTPAYSPDQQAECEKAYWRLSKTIVAIKMRLWR